MINRRLIIKRAGECCMTTLPCAMTMASFFRRRTEGFTMSKKFRDLMPRTVLLSATIFARTTFARAIFVAAIFAAAIFAGTIFPMAVANAQAVSLQEQLAAQYKLAKMGSDTSGYSVVEEGTLLVVQKGGLLGVPYSDTSVESDKYEGGVVKAPNAVLSKGIGFGMKK